jgi:hypothetical protein
VEASEEIETAASEEAALREDPSLAQDMRLLAAHARTFAEAEVAFQKARAAYVGSASRSIAVLGVVAATLVFFAAMAAILGAVIALGPVLGLWGAMAAVTLALLGLAVILALVAAAKVSRMKQVLGEGNGDAQRG